MDFLTFLGQGAMLSTLSAHVRPEDVFVGDGVVFEGLDPVLAGADDGGIATLAALVAAARFAHPHGTGLSHSLEHIDAEDGAVRGSWVGSFTTSIGIPKTAFLGSDATSHAPTSVGESFDRLVVPAVLLGRSDRFDALVAENAPAIADSNLDVFDTAGAATLDAAVILSRLYGGWDKIPLQKGHSLFFLAAASDKPDVLVVNAVFFRTA